jgi:putative ABC transport system ATP-binding protein
MVIEAKQLIHTYGNDKALNGVNLTIEEGKFVSIIGASGSGKSTLLSILSTLLKPTSGEVKLLGNDISQIKNIDSFRKENIGFVFQFHYLINYLTIKENIFLASNDEKYVNELLRYLDITDIEDKYPNQISGGQRQRAAIARAIANKPKIIFADEPTGNLDSKNSQKVFELLRTIVDSGTTVIVATHDTHLASKADIIYEVKDGTI